MPEQIKGASGVTSDNYLKWAALSLDPGLFSSDQLAVQRIHGSNLYTGTPAAALHRAEILLYTTVHLYKRYPNLAQFCARQGMAAIADMGAKAIYRGKYRRMAFEFLGGFTLRRRIGLISRAGISYLRNRLRRLRLKRFGVCLK